MTSGNAIRFLRDRLARLKVLNIWRNLLTISVLYTAVIFVALFAYASLNLSELFASKSQAEIASVASDMRDLAAHLWQEDNLAARGAILESSDLGRFGILALARADGTVAASTGGPAWISPLPPGTVERLASDHGWFKNPSTDRGSRYVFYERSPDGASLLFYFAPDAHFRKWVVTDLLFFLVSTLLLLVVLLGLLQSFRNRVYKPITNIEKVVHGIVEGGISLETISLEKAGPLYSLYSDLNLMVERLRELLLREYNANMSKKEAELVALQSQINPHFLYNTLESIRGQAISHGMDDIEIMTKALSDLFRYSISKKGNLVSLEEELQNVNNYLLIQQYRFNNKFLIVNRVDADTLQCKIPKLLIQPIVENAIHHGLETKVGKGTLTIKAYRTENRLVVSVQDDGLGMSHRELVQMNNILSMGKSAREDGIKGLKIGLVNASERIKLNFGQEYGLRLSSSKNIGTTVEIVLPLK